MLFQVTHDLEDDLCEVIEAPNPVAAAYLSSLDKCFVLSLHGSVLFSLEQAHLSEWTEEISTSRWTWYRSGERIVRLPGRFEVPELSDSFGWFLAIDKPVQFVFSGKYPRYYAPFRWLGRANRQSKQVKITAPEAIWITETIGLESEEVR